MNTGQKVTKFTALSTNGQIEFPKNNGLWTVLYIYEGDFSPTSATDILALQRALPKFLAHDSQIFAMSADSVASHLAWIMSLKNHDKNARPIEIELISDRFGKIANEFGIKVDKKKISCEDIKQFGTYEFEVKLYTGIAAKLFVMVGE